MDCLIPVKMMRSHGGHLATRDKMAQYAIICSRTRMGKMIAWSKEIFEGYSVFYQGNSIPSSCARDSLILSSNRYGNPLRFQFTCMTQTKKQTQTNKKYPKLQYVKQMIKAFHLIPVSQFINNSLNYDSISSPN